MLDFTLLTYTKGLGVMLTENCEKCYFHELYQNLLKHLSDQIHQLISKFVSHRPVDYGTLKVKIAFQCITSKFKNYELRNQMKHIFVKDTSPLLAIKTI